MSPNQLHFLLWICFITGSWSVFVHKLLINFIHQAVDKLQRNCWFCLAGVYNNPEYRQLMKNCSLFIVLCVNVQDSDAYNNCLHIRVEYSYFSCPSNYFAFPQFIHRPENACHRNGWCPHLSNPKGTFCRVLALYRCLWFRPNAKLLPTHCMRDKTKIGTPFLQNADFRIWLRKRWKVWENQVAFSDSKIVRICSIYVAHMMRWNSPWHNSSPPLTWTSPLQELETSSGSPP